MIAAVQKVLARVEAALRALPQVRKLYSVSGQHEFIAILVTDSVGEMDQLLDRNRGHRGRRSHRILDRALDTDRSLASLRAQASV